MDKQDALSEEIVIVGSRHGELADVFKPIYEKGDPIKGDSIEGLLGFDDVILSPADNSYDDYAVGVYTSDLKLIDMYGCASRRLCGGGWMMQVGTI